MVQPGAPQPTPPYANSWFFVPLLLAGGNRLQAQTEQQWRAHPHAGHEWQTLVDALRTAPPIPWRDLHNTLATLQQRAADSGHQLPAAERAILEQLTAAGSLEPAGSQVHLPWVLNVVAYPTGYVPATAQEALLQHYLGDRQASSAASLADRWRQPQHTTPTTSPDPQPARPFPTKTPPTTTPARPTPATHPATPPLPPPPHPPQARAPLTPPHHHHHNGHQQPRAPHHKRDPNNPVQMTKRITSATEQLSSPSAKSTSKKP